MDVLEKEAAERRAWEESNTPAHLIVHGVLHAQYRPHDDE
jgi:ssRNA-specific RNase YbeY (16S rRNA maturation enzyme)